MALGHLSYAGKVVAMPQKLRKWVGILMAWPRWSEPGLGLGSGYDSYFVSRGVPVGGVFWPMVHTGQDDSQPLWCQFLQRPASVRPPSAPFFNWWPNVCLVSWHDMPAPSQVLASSCDEKLIIKLWQNCKVVKVFVIFLEWRSLHSLFSELWLPKIIINNLKAGKTANWQDSKTANSLECKNRKPINKSHSESFPFFFGARKSMLYCGKGHAISPKYRI